MNGMEFSVCFEFLESSGQPCKEVRVCVYPNLLPRISGFSVSGKHPVTLIT